MMRNTLRGAELTARFLPSGAFLWFLGIGGVGMSSLARIAVLHGFSVAGEDRREDAAAALSDSGIAVYQEGAVLPAGVSAVIYTAAASPDHPTVQEATRRSVPLISRSDFLAYLMRGFPIRMTVAGSHGKTTVTSMIDRILSRAGYAPMTVSGGTLTDGATYRLGKGGVFISEACEYTDSFLSLSPTHALLLNLELDHTDYFPDYSALSRSASAYLSRAGTAIVPPSLRSLTGAGEVLTFSENGEAADLSVRSIRESPAGVSAKLFYRGERSGTLILPTPGRHNLKNALAAILAANAVGVPVPAAAEALADFTLPDRRLTLRGKWRGALWYDDYAHHPSEIVASLSALRPTCIGRLTVAFQSHTYSRTKADLSGFASALRGADTVFILPIFPARETDTLGVTNETLARAVGQKARALPDFEAAAREMIKIARPGDVMVVMGAGDVNKIFDYLGSSDGDA